MEIKIKFEDLAELVSDSEKLKEDARRYADQYQETWEKYCDARNELVELNKHLNQSEIGRELLNQFEGRK